MSRLTTSTAYTGEARYDSPRVVVIGPDCIELDQDDQPMDRPMGALWAFRALGPAAGRRYYVTSDPSVWGHFKGLIELALPRAVVVRWRSAWGVLLRTTERA